MKAEHAVDGDYLLRLSKEDVEALCPDEDTPESRATFEYKFSLLMQQLRRLKLESADHPYAKDTEHVYVLFQSYWNPVCEKEVKTQLECWLRERIISVEGSPSSGRYVKILTRNGQMPFVEFLLRNMDNRHWDGVLQHRMFAKLKNRLARTLWYNGHMVTPGSMSNTLKRAVKKVAAER